MDDSGSRQREVCQMVLGELLPGYVAASVSASQPVLPSSFRIPKVHVQQLAISRYPEILVVAKQFLAQFLPLLCYRHMPVLPAPLPDGLHGHPQLFRFGFSFEDPVSLP